MRGLVRKLDEGGLDTMTDKEALSYLNQLEAADEELFKLRQKLIAGANFRISLLYIIMAIRVQEAQLQLGDLGDFGGQFDQNFWSV